MAFVGVAGAIGISAFGIVVLQGPTYWLGLASYVIWGSCYFVATMLHDVKVRRRVAANDALVCWQCWYPLTNVESDRCPECGTPFDREALRLAWTKALYRR